MMTDDPPLLHRIDQLAVAAVLDGELLDLKCRAMLRQESQIGPMLAMLGPDNFRGMLAFEGFRDARDE
jgi:hypothetical protein